jgi:hypothetical protein
MSRTQWSRSGVLAGTAFLLTACHMNGQEAGHPCSLVGAESGIRVVYERALRGHPGRLTVKACAGGECQTVDAVDASHQPLLIVGGHQVKDATPVPVRVTVVDQTGREVFQGHTRVTPHKVQPNGPDCPPTAWVGSVVATGRHTLT